MDGSPPEGGAKNLLNLEPSADPLLLQCSLGLPWNLHLTHLPSMYQGTIQKNRNLSTCTRLYDSLEYVAPETIPNQSAICRTGSSKMRKIETMD